MKERSKMVVEAGILIGLAQILSYVVVLQMPQGGSVTAGSMIPILLFSLRWGWKKGLLMGSAYGILQFILGPKYTFHIISLLFDYVVAFAFLGFAGIFQNKGRKGAIYGAAVGIFGRFLCHFISGVVIWATYVENVNPYIYSLIYNGTYLLPEMIISMLVLALIYEPINRALDIRS